MAPKPETKTLIEMSYCIWQDRAKLILMSEIIFVKVSVLLIFILMVYAYENVVEKGCIIFIWFLHWKSWILPNDLKQ